MIVFNLTNGTQEKIDGNGVDMDSGYEVFKDERSIKKYTEEEVIDFHWEKEVL